MQLAPVDFVVPENICTPTTEGHWKFQGGAEGVFKGQNF